jgi:hypothetical protein
VKGIERWPWLVVVPIAWEYADDPGEVFGRYFAGEGHTRVEAEQDAHRVADEYVIGEGAQIEVGRSRVVRSPRRAS